jgi:hypothetical protein
VHAGHHEHILLTMSTLSVATAQHQLPDTNDNSFHQQLEEFEASRNSLLPSNEDGIPAVASTPVDGASTEQEASSRTSHQVSDILWSLESLDGNLEAKKHQFRCLYTKHKTQKRKQWHDGRLVLSGLHANVYNASPAPGSGDLIRDACELTASQVHKLIQGKVAQLETDMFLIQVEGIWVNPPANAGTDNIVTTTGGFSTSIQKILSRKFQKPQAYVPPRRSDDMPFQQCRIQNILGKRRRPLQPGELERLHYGGHVPPAQQQEQQYPQHGHGQTPTNNPVDGRTIPASGRSRNTTVSWQQPQHENLELPSRMATQRQPYPLPRQQAISNATNGPERVPTPPLGSFRLGRQGHEHEASQEQPSFVPRSGIHDTARPYSSQGFDNHSPTTLPQQHDSRRRSTTQDDVVHHESPDGFVLGGSDYPRNPGAANSFAPHQARQQHRQKQHDKRNGFVQSSGEFNANTFYGMEDDCTQNEDFEEIGGMDSEGRHDATISLVPYSVAENMNAHIDDFSSFNPYAEPWGGPEGLNSNEPMPVAPLGPYRPDRMEPVGATSSTLTVSQLLALFGAAPAQPQQQPTQETESSAPPDCTAEKRSEASLEFILPSQSSDSSSDESDD